jgi:hypothetical protein
MKIIWPAECDGTFIFQLARLIYKTFQGNIWQIYFQLNSTRLASYYYITTPSGTHTVNFPSLYDILTCHTLLFITVHDLLLFRHHSVSSYIIHHVLTTTHCSMWSRCWVVTSRWDTKQHLLLGNRFLINKYMRPLLGNTFVDKHVPMEMSAATTKSCVFYVVHAMGL